MQKEVQKKRRLAERLNGYGKYLPVYRSHQSHGILDRVDYRIIRRDGTVCWVDDYGRLLQAGQEHEVFYVFVADTTEKHKNQ